ncbi:MAG: hypothetical protein QM775_02545 [Pirellulales bacterium]
MRVMRCEHSLKAKRSSLRNPAAVRPWQHVLDPLGGYLLLSEQMLTAPRAELCDAWNFGPTAGTETTVGALAAEFTKHWPGARYA